MAAPTSASHGLHLSALIAGLLVAGIAIALAGCGGGDDPYVRLVLQADLSDQPEGSDPSTVIARLSGTLALRAEAFGAEDFSAEPREDGLLSVEIKGLSLEEAQQLIGKTAYLEFRWPVINDEGKIVCEAQDGTEFSIEWDAVSYTGSKVKRTPVCTGGSLGQGEIRWAPATGLIDQSLIFTGAYIQPYGVTVDRSGAPTLAVNFSDEGTRLLTEVTGQLVGLPLGIFVDDELVAGPTVSEPIYSGTIAIAGLSIPEANILAAQLNAGQLAAPITLVSAEAVH